jgi:hypothetical protein
MGKRKQPAIDDSLGPAMLALSPQERDFVLHYVNATRPHGRNLDAARAAGYGTRRDGSGPSTNKVLSASICQLKRKQHIRDAIVEEYKKRFPIDALDSYETIKEIGKDRRHRQQFEANKMVFQNAYTEESRHHMTVEHKIDHDAEGVAHERLVSLFGPNGLTRYERLMQLEDGRKTTITADYEDITDER